MQEWKRTDRMPSFIPDCGRLRFQESLNSLTLMSIQSGPDFGGEFIRGRSERCRWRL